MKDLLLVLFLLAFARVASGAVQCDATHECPSGDTCCRLTSGQWGCCSLPQAVCCQDGVHCCPSGYKCDISSGRCEQGSITLPWLQKKPATVKTDADANSPVKWESERVTGVRCDATHECPTGDTCCKTSADQWACCPALKAVCCQDHEHCCPEGYTCDSSGKQCKKNPTALPWVRKTTALVKVRPQKQVEGVKCDDTYECPTGNTCCRMPSGQWGCCPLPKAVCCQDRRYCCPTGYVCIPFARLCWKGSNTLPWLEKKPALIKTPLQKQVEAVKCDATHECPTGNTCCKTASGQWGCCPLPKAVCCQDHVHCCPNGYTCHPSTGRCEKGSITLPWLEKKPALIKAPLQKQVEAVKCDVTHECPTGNTCCKTASGQWGCCPLPQAVCCQDHLHCCPHDSKCDTASGKCTRGSLSLPWLEKTPSVVTP